MQSGFPRMLPLLIGMLALMACETNAPEPDETQVPGEETPPGDAEGLTEAPPTVSILREGIEPPAPPPTVPVPLEPLNATIGFPEGGARIDDDAIVALEAVLASEQIALGGPIVLHGHSDAGGSDSANERASRARAEAVRMWLTERGVAQARVTIIAFGEQNPVEPNALPDGSPNEAGRALNRRVEVLIVPPEPDAASAETGD